MYSAKIICFDIFGYCDKRVNTSNSGVITDGDIGELPMVKLMGDIRELFADSRCHFNKITLDFYTPFC